MTDWWKNDPIAEDSNNWWSDDPIADQQTAVENPIGFKETLAKEWTGTEALKKIPVIGAGISMAQMESLREAAVRFQKPDFDYKTLNMATAREHNQPKYIMGIGYVPKAGKPYVFSKEDDLKRVRDYINKIVEEQKRGYTFWGKVTKGVSILPTWMTEFALTGGLAKIGSKVGKEVIFKILQKQTKTAIGKLALRTAGWTGGAITRASLGLTGRVGAGAVQRQLEADTGQREKEGWATSIAKSWGQQVIESASEEAGGRITKVLGKAVPQKLLTNKYITGLRKTWVKVTGGTTGQFYKKLITKGGYSNLIGEIGEEWLGQFLRDFTGVSDNKGNVIQRVWQGLKQQTKDLPVTATVLSVPMGGQLVMSRLGGQPQSITKGVSEYEKPSTKSTPENKRTRPKKIKVEAKLKAKPKAVEARPAEKQILSEEAQALKRANPMLFRRAQKAKSVDEFIDSVVKADKTTREHVSIPVLTGVYNRVKALTLPKADEAIAKIGEKATTKKDLEEQKQFSFTPDPTIEEKTQGKAGFIGITGGPGEKIKKPWLTLAKTTSPDTQIEDFFGRTKKMPSTMKASHLLNKIKAGIRERFITQTPYIPDDPEFALAKDMIRTMPEQQRAKKTQAIDDILEVLDGDGTVQALDNAGLDLLRRKVFTQDLLQEAKIDRSIAGNLTQEQLEGENNRLDKLIAQVPSVKKAFEARQKLWNQVSQDLYERGVINEEAAHNQFYVRHFVLNYIDNKKQPISKPKKLSAPYRAYSKKRKGSKKDISTDYLTVEVKALAEIYADNAIEDMANQIGKKYNKRTEFKKEAKETGRNINDIATENGYVEWHYKRPNLFYQAETFSEAKMAAMLENSAEDAGEILKIPKTAIRSALVIGKRRKEMYLPEGLAKQLDNLPVNKRSSFVVESFSKPVWQWWKRWILRVNPFRYNARNELGDIERLNAAGQTEAIKKLPEAVELLVTKEHPEYKNIDEFGVAGSSLWHEMGDVSRLKHFEKFKDLSRQKNFKAIIKKTFETPLRLVSGIGQIEQNLTQFREDLLRVAVYLHNLEKIKKGEKVRHWAGKLADIEAIAKDSPERAAAKMSRETLIDYGSFTPFENDVLRNGLMPFYSFFKRNTTFWPRAIKNAAKEGAGGKTVGIAAAKGSYNIAKWLIRILSGYAIAWLWNHKDDKSKKKEKSLSFWLRSMLHINIGDYTLWGQTALSDFMEWIDYPSLASVNWRKDAGFISAREAGIEASRKIAQAPVNKLYQTLNPFMKTSITAITGQTTWPSVFEPYFVATPASKKSVERAILDILGTDAKRFYQSCQGKRKFEDTLFAYFANWWCRSMNPEILAEQIKQTKEWSSLKRRSKITGRKAGEAKKGKEEQWQEARIRESAIQEND